MRRTNGDTQARAKKSASSNYYREVRKATTRGDKIALKKEIPAILLARILS
jgi:hypothetical protein